MLIAKLQSTIMWFIVTFIFSSFILPAAVRGIQTKNTVWPEYKIFYPIKNDKLEFQVWSGHDAWIGLFEEPYPTGHKYEVLLGSNNNKQVEILWSRRVSLQKINVKVLNFYDYSGFVIKFQNRIKSPDFMISVFRAGETRTFASIIQHQHIDVKYFALATTGEDLYGYWKLKDIDENSGIHVDTNITNVITKAKLGSPIYTTFYKLIDNVVRFRVKARHYAWIRLTPKRASFPNYEVCIGTKDDLVVLYKNRTTVASVTQYSVLSKYKYTGFWIDFTESTDDYGNKVYIICVGYENNMKSFIRYIDSTPSFAAKHFSIATTSDINGIPAYWQLENLLPY